MKYLFLFLLLTACTTPKTETKQEAAAVPVEQPAQTVSEAAPEEDTDEIHDDDPEIPETISLSQYKISLYLTNINPHRKQYEQFFEEQLKIYGRDDNGELLVNLRKIWAFNDSNGFSPIGDPVSFKTIGIEIIEHGKTNYYPVLD